LPICDGRAWSTPIFFHRIFEHDAYGGQRFQSARGCLCRLAAIHWYDQITFVRDALVVGAVALPSGACRKSQEFEAVRLPPGQRKTLVRDQAVSVTFTNLVFNTRLDYLPRRNLLRLPTFKPLASHIQLHRLIAGTKSHCRVPAAYARASCYLGPMIPPPPTLNLLRHHIFAQVRPLLNCGMY